MAKGLPKKYIKKYGVSKRAWREYRKTKSRSIGKHKTKTRRSRMAKRKSYRRRRSTLGGLEKPIGVGLGILYGSVVPGGQIGRLAIGYMTHRKAGIVGGVGTALLGTAIAEAVSGNINLGSLGGGGSGGITSM